MQQVNALTSGLLMTAFRYATSEYEEICRRFCVTTSDDEDVKKFQELARKTGIPKQWLDVDLWDVEACTPLGMGNPAMAMTQAQQLMSVSGALDATAQQEVKHEFVLAVTGDARKAARLVPLGKQRPMSDAARDAQLLFGTLMQGVPVKPMEGLSPIDQIESMLPLFAGKITRITQRDNMATPDEGDGLQEVGNYISQLIGALSSDPQQKQRVKQYGDAIGKLMNEVKGLVQRGAQQRQKLQQQNGHDPMADAKVDALMKSTAAKVHAKQIADSQKLKQKDKAFIHEQRRKDAATFADIQREQVQSKNRLSSFNE